MVERPLLDFQTSQPTVDDVVSLIDDPMQLELLSVLEPWELGWEDLGAEGTDLSPEEQHMSFTLNETLVILENFETEVPLLNMLGEKIARNAIDGILWGWFAKLNHCMQENAVLMAASDNSYMAVFALQTMEPGWKV